MIVDVGVGVKPADTGAQGIARDEDRTLTPEGKSRTCEVARGLAACGVRPAIVGASPLARAVETAALVAEVLDRPAPEVCDFMRPGGRTADLVAWLKVRGVEKALVVGHLPDVARMAAELMGMTDAPLVFKKAAVAALEFEETWGLGRGQLLWLMQPGPLRRLGAE